MNSRGKTDYSVTSSNTMSNSRRKQIDWTLSEIMYPRRLTQLSLLTNEVIESKQYPAEFSLILHYDPYPGANASIDEFCPVKVNIGAKQG